MHMDLDILQWAFIILLGLPCLTYFLGGILLRAWDTLCDTK